MPETITFETAALADVVSKAARVAPTKGAAFDKVAGLLMTYDPTAAVSVTIKATDLDVTFLETMTPLASTITQPFKWRIPSTLFSGIMSGLPLGTQTKLENKGDGLLYITCGKSKSKIRLFADVLTDFDAFDESPLAEVPGFAARVQQVAWACDKDAIPFTGVYIDGERLVATDRYRLAVVPLKVPVDEPICVPLDILSGVAKNAVDARLAAVGRRLHLMPSEHAQITTVIYDTKYPPVERIMYRGVGNGPDDNYDQSFEVDKEALFRAINRMLVLVKGERYPLMNLTIGEGRVHILMNVEDVGEMEDEVPVVGADHPDFKMVFTPGNFVDGIQHTNKPTIKVSYLTTNPVKNMLFEDGEGYECWIVPRVP